MIGWLRGEGEKGDYGASLGSGSGSACRVGGFHKEDEAPGKEDRK